MKKWILFTMIVFFKVTVFGQPNDLYNAESGKIEYRYEMGDMTMDYTLVFKDKGKLQAFEISNTESGSLENSKTIITPEFIYVVNYLDEQVLKIPNSNDETMEMYGQSGGFNVTDLVKNITGMQKQKSGSEKVLGKNCDVFVFKDGDTKGKYWIWNGFLLKAEFLDDNGEHAFIMAKQFDLDQPVPDQEFDIPAGFEVTDMTDMMEQMKQMQEMYGVPTEEEE